MNVEWFWNILTGEPISLSTPLSSHEGRYTLEDVLPDRDSPRQDELLRRARHRELVRDVLRQLGERDSRWPYIIRHRFGLDGREVMTLQELGDRLGLSRERVRQLQRMALAEMRRRLAGRVE